MSLTIKTEAGQVNVEAAVGRVTVNGSSMLAHEAMAMGSALFQAANEANCLAAKVASESLQNVVPF